MRFLYHTFFDPFWGDDYAVILNLNRTVLIISFLVIFCSGISGSSYYLPPNMIAAQFGIWLFLILVKVWGEPKPKRKNDDG